MAEVGAMSLGFRFSRSQDYVYVLNQKNHQINSWCFLCVFLVICFFFWFGNWWLWVLRFFEENEKQLILWGGETVSLNSKLASPENSKKKISGGRGRLLMSYICLYMADMAGCLGAMVPMAIRHLQYMYIYIYMYVLYIYMPCVKSRSFWDPFMWPFHVSMNWLPFLGDSIFGPLWRSCGHIFHFFTIHKQEERYTHETWIIQDLSTQCIGSLSYYLQTSI